MWVSSLGHFPESQFCLGGSRVLKKWQFYERAMVGKQEERAESCDFFPCRFAQDSQWNLFERHFSKARRLVKKTNASLFGSHGFVRFLECHVLMLQKMPEGASKLTPPGTRHQPLQVPVCLPWPSTNT